MLENQRKTVDFETLTDRELNEILEQFYASLQSKRGAEYSKSALVSIRAGINRYLTSEPFSRPISLMKNRVFMSSNQVLGGIIKGLKRDEGC
ncbi:hypothetical protein DPMN_111304 [Dreissena polymorpha]|uniref:Uncharacterized protein n=1 Tax=Dreissena polymorpha TaxID=45954 RepID=A0A9D4QPN5_DREPO|nr:hypothetical protein DPMN_111304 [Dreissena polymorpha]